MKTLVCEVCWMNNYCGNNEEDRAESIFAKYVENIEEEFERENFLNINNKYYGFSANFLKNDKLVSMTIENGEKVNIIWVGENPQSADMQVVGWYGNASMYRKYIECNSRLYNLEVDAKDAILLGVKDRVIKCNFLKELFSHNELGDILVVDEDSEGDLTNLKKDTEEYIKKSTLKGINLVYHVADFDRVSDIESISIEECFNMTRKFLKQDELLEVIAVLNRLILSSPDLKELYEEKAYVLYLLNQYDMAIYNLQIGNSIDNKSLRNYALITDIYYTIGNTEKALDACNNYFQIIKENNYDVDAEVVIEMFKLQIYCLYELDKIEEAILVIERAIKIAPDDKELLDLKEEIK